MRWRLVLVGVLAAASFWAGVVVAVEQEPDTRGAREVDFSVRSRLVDRDLPAKAVIPADVADGERRPLLVYLHGRGGDPGEILWKEFYDALAELGPRAPIVVAFSGGDSYWHDRRSGRWGTYVMREALPAAIARTPADPERVAIGGISMGGFGALDIARRHPGRFCAAGGHSAAIHVNAGNTMPGAFDEAADFARHDLYQYARRTSRPFPGTKVWIDYGRDDWFVAGNQAFVRALRARGARLTSRSWPGGHETEYWRAHIDEYLRFYADALASC